MKLVAARFYETLDPPTKVHDVTDIPEHRNVKMVRRTRIYRGYNGGTEVLFLGAFLKLRKSTISFVMSARFSVRMEQLGSQWTDFHEV